MSEKSEACHCCGFETDELTLYADSLTTLGGGGSTVRADFWFCRLCASTMASTFHRYPSHVPSNTEVLKAVCLIGNKVLAAIAAHSLPTRRAE